MGEGNRGRRRYRRNPGLRTHRAGSANRTPRTEHFAPLFVSLGAVADAKVDAVSAVDGFWYGLAKRSFQFN